MKTSRNIRLYVNKKLILGQIIDLSESQSHYLSTVMRCKLGDNIKCFNESDGEFLCSVISNDKKRNILEIKDRLRAPQTEKTDIWLIFAPLKKDCMDFVVEKAVELGVSAIMPVITHYTNSERIRLDRLQAQATEASEQCGRLSIPQIYQPTKLEDLLANFASDRILYFMDERRTGAAAADIFKNNASSRSAILIGPEGGFSQEEAALLSKYNFVKAVSLGPRILRAETAAISALAVWQSIAGDWHQNEENK